MSKKKFAQRQAPNVATAVLRKPGQTKTYTATIGMTYWFTALLLVLPVIFSREAQDPAITPRYILLGFFILFYTVFFYFFNNTKTQFAYPPLVKYVFITGFVFTAWSIVCLFFSVNPTAGYYEIVRQLLNLLLLFFITEMIAANETAILKICKVFVVIGLIQSFVGILQFYDIAFINLPGANAKPFGLMANRNLFGSAQTFVIPFVVFVLYRASAKWKYAAAVSLVMLIISVIVSQTRSAWLAALAVIIVALVLVIIFSARNRKKWIIATGISILIIFCTGALLIAIDKEGGLTQQVKERTASLVNEAGDSTHSKVTINDRLVIWKKTAELVKDHPLTGVGQGNWKLNILSYGSKGSSWAGGYFVPDRVHNVYLHTAAENGVPGALIYIIFYVLIAIAGIKVISKPATEEQRIIVILMLAGLAAFATDSMFSFPTERIEHMLYVMMMAGIILGSYVANKKNAVTGNPLPRWLLYTILLTALVNVIMGLKKHSFEKNLNYAKAYENEGRYQEMLGYTAAGKNTWVNVDQLGLSLEAKDGIAYRGQKNYPQALEQMNIALTLNPNSAMVYNNLGTIYTEMADYKKAIENYEKALKLTPDFEIVKKNLAFNYFNVGNYKGTIKTLEGVKINDDEFLVNLLNDAKRLAASQP